LHLINWIPPKEIFRTILWTLPPVDDSARTAMTTRILVAFQPSLQEVPMICRNVHSFAALPTPALALLLAIGLIASTPLPLLAQASGTWTSTGTLNTPRSAHTATLLQNGQVLVTGGEDVAHNVLSSAELYNPATGKWIFTGSMATPRVEHTATLLPNGEVLVAGGFNSQNPLLASAELYNPSTGQWATTSSMTIARASHGATLLRNGEVLVAGGATPGDSSGNTAELYDPSKGTWTATGSMHNYHPLALTTLQDGRALKVDASGTTGAPGELYDPSSGQWTLTAGMYYSHTGVSTALLPNGDVLVYGNKFSCYAGEFYNPFNNTWARTLGQCGNAISHGPLTLLGSGKVLLAGGSVQYSGKSFPTANCRLYDPATNSWIVTGSLLQSGGHSTTRLLNGQVLAVGGSDTELYTP
jgi:Galactose oxidase, central domain/Kelch motif